jgi:hypothetical protein
LWSISYVLITINWKLKKGGLRNAQPALLPIGLICTGPDHSMVIASTGHTSTHAPQSPQVSASITAKPSFIAMASNGHDSTQVSQPVHFSALTTAGMNYLPRQIEWNKQKIIRIKFILTAQPLFCQDLKKTFGKNSFFDIFHIKRLF